MKHWENQERGFFMMVLWIISKPINNYVIKFQMSSWHLQQGGNDESNERRNILHIKDHGL